MQEFGRFIRNKRTDKKLTQTQLAAKLGIDSAALSKIENGKKVLDPKKLSILSKIFSIELNKIKVEYFGEKMATELYSNGCPQKTFIIAEEKYKYLKSKPVEVINE